MFSHVHTDHLTIARWYADHPNDWPLAPRFDPVKRWSHRLTVAADTEVWLLTWLPGQGSDLHDHGGSAGSFVVLSGTLTEQTLRDHASERSTLEPTRLPVGAGREFDAHHVHQLTNDGDRPAVSVHVYGPALQTMTRYRLDDGKLHMATVDRAGVQW
jgi:predicted metal-dependent enzyme (double-stranded beta helix superfamily)